MLLDHLYAAKVFQFISLEQISLEQFRLSNFVQFYSLEAEV